MVVRGEPEQAPPGARDQRESHQRLAVQRERTSDLVAQPALDGRFIERAKIVMDDQRGGAAVELLRQIFAGDDARDEHEAQRVAIGDDLLHGALEHRDVDRRGELHDRAAIVQRHIGDQRLGEPDIALQARERRGVHGRKDSTPSRLPGGPPVRMHHMYRCGDDRAGVLGGLSGGERPSRC